MGSIKNYMATKKTTKKPTKTVAKKASSRKASESVVFDSEVMTLASAKETKTTNVITADAPKFYTQRRFLIPVLGVVIIGLVGFYSYKFLVVASVDGSPIWRTEYYKQLDAKYGTNQKEQMITEFLINSEASKRHVSVTDAEVNTEIKKYQDQQGGADKFQQALTDQGYSLDDVKKGVRLRLLVNKMFASSGSVSDDEVTKYMADNKDQFTTSSDTVKVRVKQQLSDQKIGAAFNQWLAQATQSNRVIKY